MFGISGITKLTNGTTRLFTAENVYGEKGRGGMADLTELPQPEVKKIGQKWDGPCKYARDMGIKWKERPFITLPAESRTVIVDAKGPGRITHVWVTLDPKIYRDVILRICWDGESEPSVESPIGDFFCCGFSTSTTNAPSIRSETDTVCTAST